MGSGVGVGAGVGLGVGVGVAPGSGVGAGVGVAAGRAVVRGVGGAVISGAGPGPVPGPAVASTGVGPGVGTAVGVGGGGVLRFGVGEGGRVASATIRLALGWMDGWETAWDGRKRVPTRIRAATRKSAMDVSRQSRRRGLGAGTIRRCLTR